MIPLSAAASRIGISRQRLRNAIVDGMATAVKKPMSPLSHGKPGYFFEEEEVVRLERAFEEYVPRSGNTTLRKIGIVADLEKRISDLEVRVKKLEQVSWIP